MPSELLSRLNTVYDESFAAKVMDSDNQDNWRPAGTFPPDMDPVRRIVVHETAGWPHRARAAGMGKRYLYDAGATTCKAGGKCKIGTQLFIAHDGTVSRLIDLPRRTIHAPHVNDHALGVETANPLDGDPGNSNHMNIHPSGSSRWKEASSEDNDIPGAKLYFVGIREVLGCWWTTDTFATDPHAPPAREGVGAEFMLFSEWQYRAWALLVRYLCERFHLPRNFPLIPHILRADLNDDADLFRRIVMADERADVMRRVYAQAPFNITESSFEPANAETLEEEYTALKVNAVADQHRTHNRAWTEYIEEDMFRGIQGHGFSGATSENDKGKPSDKEQCPGPLFDFHRLAREVWDWWWYPFDVSAVGSTNTPLRSYRKWSKLTPLLEYYFDENPDDRTVRLTQGIYGPHSSPSTFTLDSGSPIYALANGELVAARFPTTGDVSLAFVLVRHEVFYKQDASDPVAEDHGFPTNIPDQIDYNQPPAYVYSLYMHLGRPPAMTFTEVHNDNPDWLNRILIRKKECDLGVAFYDANAQHSGIPNASHWDDRSRAPGTPRRPTTLEGWRADQRLLTDFIDDLSVGHIAVATPHPDNTLANLNHRQPIRIILGDFLGHSGVISHSDDVTTHGIRVEVFSPSFNPPGFSKAHTPEGWAPPFQLSPPYNVCYVSEWARHPTASEQTSLEAIGVDTTKVFWWLKVATALRPSTTLPTEAKLPLNGQVFHYDPLDFMQWLNEVTWRHEWRKYGVTDASGQPVPIETNGVLRQPRSRRI